MNKKFLIIGLLSLVATVVSACKLETSTPTATSAAPSLTSPPLTETAAPDVTPTPTPIPAFLGAEGFGANTPGGRGGRVIEVTSLQDSGPGSLRAAVEAEGPRIVVFRVAGMIELQSTLVILNPYITIAGQTAPGGGITLRDVDAQVDPLMDIQTHDVVVRYLTFRAGPPAAGDAMNISVSSETWEHDVYNIVVDHNSMSWGVDQVFATWYDVHDLSIQWNIFSEALNCSIHEKGCHSKGPMLGSYASDENKDKPGAHDLSFHHNLMAHNGERNPLVKTAGLTDVVNNVIYNPFGTFSHVDMENQLVKVLVNYVGNYFKPGTNTDAGKYGIRQTNPGPIGAEIFVEGNIGPGRLTDDLPQINIVNPDTRQYVVPNRFPAPPITTTSALDAYTQVLADAGNSAVLICDGTFIPRRDKIDERIINDVKMGTGKIIDDPSQVGGYLTPDPGTPCTDSDHDGMPDVWELKYGFNPNNLSDNAADADDDGYTNIEEYLNGTNPINR